MTDEAAPHLLITGFGPFPGVPVNPSALIARRLVALPRLRRTIGNPRILILRTAYDAIPEMLAPALAARPAAILMLGVAGRAERVRVEGRAVNRASRLFPDASGRVSARPSLDEAGPAQRRSAVAGPALLRLRGRGIAADPSRDAGRYLCNASYFAALAGAVPVLFLHVPPFTRAELRGGGGPRTARLVEAIADVAHLLMLRARRGF